jgi:putative oxidoreductase
MFRRLAATRASFAVILIRLMVGSVFLSEGIQKLLFPGDPDRGAARFAKLGYPSSDLVSSFVASFEIVCGVLILLGLVTRVAVLPTIAIMIVAISTTKIPLMESKGFWDMAHAARTDWCMLLGSVFLLIVGAGRWSIDAVLSRSPRPSRLVQ